MKKRKSKGERLGWDVLKKTDNLTKKKKKLNVFDYKVTNPYDYEDVRKLINVNKDKDYVIK